MQNKAIILIISTIILLASIGASVYLIRQRQQVKEKAAVPEGQATTSLSPETDTRKINEAFTATIFFNTHNIPIEALALRLTYPYSGTEPELTTTSIDISPTFTADGDWRCPVKTISPDNGTVNIDIACFNTAIEGFSTSTDIQLATINFVANRIPETNPVVVKFDQTESVITKKIDAQDTLLIPTSSGSYTIVDAGSQTPTATSAPPPPEQPIPTATSIPTATAVPTSPPPPPPTKAAVIPTKAPQVPVTGHSFPTTLLGTAGLLLIILGAIIG